MIKVEHISVQLPIKNDLNDLNSTYFILVIFAFEFYVF